MEKRLFLAIALSILVLMAYSGVVSRFYPNLLPEKTIQHETALGTVPIKPANEMVTTEVEMSYSEAIPTAELPSIPTKISQMENADLSFSINSRENGITNCKINSYNSILPQNNMGQLIEWAGREFKDSSTADGIIATYEDKDRDLEIQKTYRFTDNKFIVELSLDFISHSTTNRNVNYSLNIGSITQDFFKQDPNNQRYAEISISLPNNILRSNFQKLNSKAINDKIQWIGIRDRYFCSIVKPGQDAGNLVYLADKGTYSYALQVPVFELKSEQRVRHAYLIYLGPQKLEFIRAFGSGAENIVNFGFFDALSHILLGALRSINAIAKNWGLTIILFSILVFVLLMPLSIKSFSSIKKMQELQPIVEELRVKYKDSPQKMNKEIMELYRERKINPLGGCLPMVLQMPIFIALYQTLMRFIDLKGASFLWIKDLSEPDRLVVLKQGLPIIGNELNLLPIIMIVLMLLQQHLTSGKQAISESAKQQKMMSLFMSVFFGIIFYHMSAGLVLYWTVNSFLMLIFQLKIVKVRS